MPGERAGAIVPVGQGAGQASLQSLASPLHGKPAIAVLPFADTTQEPGGEGFVSGLVEDITTALSQFPWLCVAARRAQAREFREK